MLQVGNILFDRVGQMNMIQLLRRIARVYPLDDTSRHADDGRVWRYLMQNNAARTDLGIVSNRKRTKYFGACTNHDVVADGWMTLAVLLARTAECNALIERNIVADNRRFSYNNAVSMVNKKAFSYLCTGMNFDAGLSCRTL